MKYHDVRTSPGTAKISGPWRYILMKFLVCEQRHQFTRSVPRDPMKNQAQKEARDGSLSKSKMVQRLTAWLMCSFGALKRVLLIIFVLARM